MYKLNFVTNIKRLILITTASLTLLLGLFIYTDPTVQAQQTQTHDLCTGANFSFDKQGAGCAKVPCENDPNKFCDAKEGEDAGSKVSNLINDIVNIFSVIVGIVAVIMIIYGGFRYMTSGGDSGKVTDARNTILYAIVGLIIVAFAQLIVKFVLSRIA